MSQITQQLLKVELAHDRKFNALLNMETGGKIQYFRDSGIVFEVNLTRNGQVVDVSNLLAVTLDIHLTSARNSAIILTKTISQVNVAGTGWINTGLSQADHSAKLAGAYHFRFDFADSENGSGLYGGSPADEVEHWVDVYSVASGSRLILGCGTFLSEYSGVAAIVSSPPAGGVAISYAEAAAMIAGLVPWHITGDKQLQFVQTMPDGKKATRSIGLAIDPEQGPVPVDSIEIEQ